MKRTLILLGMILAGIQLAGADLVIADGTRSDYQIVIPESSGNKRLDHFIEVGGKVLRTAIRKASGANVPLVKESKRIPGKPAIFVGNTKALKGAGLSSAGFDKWEHSIAVRGKDIYIYGKDLGNPVKRDKMPWRFVRHAPASLKGCCVFAEKFLNTRFVGLKDNCDDEDEGVRSLPKVKLTVPENYAYRHKMRFTVLGDHGGLLYAVANNFCYLCDTRLDVHYISHAIPYKKYFKDHPEYFALINGKRSQRDGLEQYCMTNPDVQKMEYEDALRRADEGWRVVELGHADGFIGCECPRCKAWYNTSDWGEKMWLHQRDFAARLQKDRPEADVCISCYGVTHCLPKTFTKFPGKGVYINVAPATKKLIDGWKKFNLLGMNAWVYYMGAYRAAGFSPYESFKMLQREAKWLRATPITSLYQCGFLTCHGINGPWLYAWGKFLDDSDTDIPTLLKDYCRFSFGEKAAPAFIRFFSRIDRQMEKYPLDPGQDFNDFTGKHMRQTALELWTQRYPEKVIAELSRHFAEGEKLCDPANPMLKLLKMEFEYVKLSAEVCNAAKLQAQANTYKNRCRLADALEARNKFIKSVPLRKDGRTTDVFNFVRPSLLQDGGWMAGRFGGVFNSDPKLLRLNAPEIKAVKVKDFADPAWSKVPVQKLKGLKANKPDLGAVFQLAYNDKAILLKVKAPLGKFDGTPVPRDSSKIWNNRVWEFFVADGNYRRQFSFNAVKNSGYDAMISGGGSHWASWRGTWDHQDKITNGIWESCVTLPFAGCGLKLTPGLRIQMQIAFNAWATDQALYAWHIPLSGRFDDLTGFGAVTFGEAPAVREIDVNSRFDRKDAKGKLLYWSTDKLKMEVVKTGKGNALKVSGAVTRFDAAHNSMKIPVNPDEELVITAELSGKGKVSFSGQWRNNAGCFVSNDGRPDIALTARPAKVQVKFQPGYFLQKGAANVRFSLYLQKPGGEMTIHALKAEVRKK